MEIKYTHTSIIAKDWKKLAAFYEQVFNCVLVPPERNHFGAWLDKGTGVKNAHIQGVHLRLPGYGDNGPTLEIYQYSETLDCEKQLPNRQGFGHMAFQVDDVEDFVSKALKHGGSKFGEISQHRVENVGLLCFIYISDPEGNMIEIQNWS